MMIYIRSKSDFSVRLSAEVSEYDYYLDQWHDSSFSVPQALSGYEGELLCIYAENNYVGIIDSMSPKDSVTKIKCKPLLTLLDRSVVQAHPISYYQEGEGEMLLAHITSEWTNAADAAYRCPWLDTGVNGADHGIDPELDDAGMFNVYDWIKTRVQDARAYRVKVLLSGTQVMISFLVVPSALIYDMTTGRYQLDSETSSNSVVAKITNHTYDDTSEEWTATDYYLFDDGSCGTDPAAGTRVQGAWKHLLKKTVDDVAAEFAKNEYKHTIKFWALDLPDLGSYDTYDYRPLTVKLPDGRQVATMISALRLLSTDDRAYIETGSSDTTLTEYLRRRLN